MEMSNHNHIQKSPESTPRMSTYEDSDYYELQHEPLNKSFDAMQPIHYDRSNDSSLYYPNDNHTRNSDDAEQFNRGDDGSLEYQNPMYCGFYYPNVYPYSYYISPANNAHMLTHGNDRHFYDREYDNTLYDHGNIQDPYLETDLSRSPYRDFDTTNYPRFPFDLNYSQQKHVYENRYNSYPTNTWKVDSSSSDLESPTTDIVSGNDTKIQCNDIAQLDTEHASAVETETHNTSTTPKILKEKKKKDKSSRVRRKRSKEHSSPIFHITWDGFGEQECETIEQVCPLCGDDLAFSHVDEYEYDYYEQIDGPQNYPEVSVLACGHVYHRNCLDQVTTEQQCSDPLCFICLSLES